MEHLFSEEAIVLYKKELAKAHRQVYLLTQSHALLSATCFGVGYSKGRRAALTTPYALVKVYLQHDTKGYTLTDVEEIQVFSNLALDLNKFYQAALYAEALIKSEGGGLDNRFFGLYKQLFTSLQREELTASHTLTFLLFFLYYNGLLPAYPFTQEEKNILATENWAQSLRHPWAPALQRPLLKVFKEFFPAPLKSFSGALRQW